MSSIVNKIKDAITPDKHHEGSHGPHDSKAANAADPRVDSDRDGSHTVGGATGTHNTLGSSTHTGTHGTHGTTLGQKFDGPAPHTAGPHKSDALNKLDPRVDSDRDGSKTLGGSGTTGAHTGAHTGTHTGAHTGTHTGTHTGAHTEGSHGPHNSNILNAADPRVDSDRDGSKTLGGGHGTTGGLPGTHGTHGTTGGLTGGSGLTGSHGTHGTTGGLTGGHGTTGGLTGSHGNTGFGGQGSQGNHGPHDSKVLNTLDPRVDSDRDGSKTLGGSGGHGTTGGLTGGSGLTGSHGTHGTGGLTGGSGLTGSHGTHGTTGGLTGGHGTAGGLTGSHGNTGFGGEGNHGPHSSNVLNAVDPRVDSDRDGSRTLGGSGGMTGGSGLTGTHGSHGTGGLTGGSGLTGSHNTSASHQNPIGRVGAAVAGTHGTGPAHNTAGPHKSDALNKADPRVDSDLDGSKTFGADRTFQSGHKDPTDAAHVPPSVLRQHIGEPSIEHEDHTHHRERRHSVVSHQDQFSGV